MYSMVSYIESLDSYHSLPNSRYMFVVGVPVCEQLLNFYYNVIWVLLCSDFLAQNQIPSLLFLFIFLVVCF